MGARRRGRSERNRPTNEPRMMMASADTAPKSAGTCDVSSDSSGRTTLTVRTGICCGDAASRCGSGVMILGSIAGATAGGGEALSIGGTGTEALAAAAGGVAGITAAPNNPNGGGPAAAIGGTTFALVSAAPATVVADVSGGGRGGGGAPGRGVGRG